MIQFLAIHRTRSLPYCSLACFLYIIANLAIPANLTDLGTRHKEVCTHQSTTACRLADHWRRREEGFGLPRLGLPSGFSRPGCTARCSNLTVAHVLVAPIIYYKEPWAVQISARVLGYYTPASWTECQHTNQLKSPVPLFTPQSLNLTQIRIVPRIVLSYDSD